MTEQEKLMQQIQTITKQAENLNQSIKIGENSLDTMFKNVIKEAPAEKVQEIQLKLMNMKSILVKARKGEDYSQALKEVQKYIEDANSNNK